MPRLTLLGLVRCAAVLPAALATATVLPRWGVPSRFVPDLVVLVVAATALVRGATHGALVGLAAGWVVDLVPPGGSPLGLTALLYAVAGAAAGTVRSIPGDVAAPGLPSALLALVVATVIVEGGRLVLAVLAVLADVGPDWRTAVARVAVTLAVGVAATPLLLGVDRALTRRRLA